ncbi:helix-turn-helix domain-containing protein [Nocardiopsis sp. NPDC057823]|uniref:helix-turn-helix domain-containing protein n=1 Tax=Nocardiopsis sp. NPDC057823 TaxID=3346256 RepID=UPI00366B55B5
MPEEPSLTPQAAHAELRTRLNTAREVQRLQVTQLGIRARLGRTTVSEALNHKQKVPTRETVRALAQALKLDPDPLLVLREIAVSPSPATSDENAHEVPDRPKPPPAKDGAPQKPRKPRTAPPRPDRGSMVRGRPGPRPHRHLAEVPAVEADRQPGDEEERRSETVDFTSGRLVFHSSLPNVVSAPVRTLATAAVALLGALAITAMAIVILAADGRLDEAVYDCEPLRFADGSHPHGVTATVVHTEGLGVITRCGPGAEYDRSQVQNLTDGVDVTIVCQVRDGQVLADLPVPEAQERYDGYWPVWNKLSTGVWVSDLYVDTPKEATSTPPEGIPLC